MVTKEETSKVGVWGGGGVRLDLRKKVPAYHNERTRLIHADDEK